MISTDFTRKKVTSLTLGERLRKIRSDHRISLSEVSRTTKIQAKYLEAIENGEYDKLPAEVYVKGFLRNYASFLGVPEDAILKLYERERRIQKNLGRVETPKFQPNIPIHFSVSLTPKAVLSGMIFLVVFGFFSYLYFEFRSFVSEPRLVVLEPTDGSIVGGSETTVRGETDRRAKVTINNDVVTVDESGAFSDTLQLQPGTNIIAISSVNRFGKERHVDITVQSTFESSNKASDASTITPEAKSFSISVQAQAANVLVSVQSDGVVVFSGPIASGEEKRFDANTTISVSSNSGKSTLVKVGDGSPVPLSANAGSAEGTFSSEGKVTTQDIPSVKK